MEWLNLPRRLPWVRILSSVAIRQVLVALVVIAEVLEESRPAADCRKTAACGSILDADGSSRWAGSKEAMKPVARKFALDRHQESLDAIETCTGSALRHPVRVDRASLESELRDGPTRRRRLGRSVQDFYSVYQLLGLRFRHLRQHIRHRKRFESRSPPRRHGASRGDNLYRHR